MQRSKPGKKLNPIIAAVTAPIFERDPVRYQRLVVWVWWAQKHGWPDEAIAKTLELTDGYLDQAPDWWKYLTKVLPKGKARAHEAEAEHYKTEVGELTEQFIEFLRLRAGGKG